MLKTIKNGVSNWIMKKDPVAVGKLVAGAVMIVGGILVIATGNENDEEVIATVQEGLGLSVDPVQVTDEVADAVEEVSAVVVEN